MGNAHAAFTGAGAWLNPWSAVDTTSSCSAMRPRGSHTTSTLSTCPVEALLSDSELVLILERLPPETCFATAALVCKRWLRVAACPELWRPSLPPGVALHSPFQVGPGGSNTAAAAWPALFYKLLYGTNLLQDPLFQQPALSMHPRAYAHVHGSSWMCTCHGGHGWQADREPPSSMGGAALPPRPLPALDALHVFCPRPSRARGAKLQRPAPEPLGAVASSFAWCELVQEVDLHAELRARGLAAADAAALLDSAPPLAFSVWHGARSDCDAEACVMVVLDDGSQPSPPYTGRADFPWDRTALACWAPERMRSPRSAWQRATHTFEGYPRGVRRAIVVLRGKDMQFWAGHYGAKFCAPELAFVPPTPVQ